MKYRVDELAARSGLSVDTVRFYQSKGLLQQPERSGRTAWYSDEHLGRLARIRHLKEAGFTLASIQRLLSGALDPADEALVNALVQSGDAARGSEEPLTLEDLAARTGVSPALLQAIEREGLLPGRNADGRGVYTSADAAVVAAGLKLLEAGLPLSELLALAREHDEVIRRIAARAVDLFVSFVRDPIRASASSDDEAAEKLVEAFRDMLSATSELVAGHFERVLLAEARARIALDDSSSPARAGTA